MAAPRFALVRADRGRGLIQSGAVRVCPVGGDGLGMIELHLAALVPDNCPPGRFDAAESMKQLQDGER